MKLVIVVAGGNGQRMKAKENKIFLKILGKPILSYTLATLERVKIIDKVLIVGRKEDIKRINQIVKKGRFKKVKGIFPARESRQKSTWEVLKELTKNGIKETDLIGVHNAVNPLVKDQEIIDVFTEAKKYGAALLAVAARDTVKIIDKDEFVKETPLRKFVFNAQTPQVGRFDWLYEAHQKAEKENFEGTDDTMLMERIGKKVKVVFCSPENFKITFPFDLSLASAILKRRKNERI